MRNSLTEFGYKTVSQAQSPGTTLNLLKHLINQATSISLVQRPVLKGLIPTITPHPLVTILRMAALPSHAQNILYHQAAASDYSTPWDTKMSDTTVIHCSDQPSRMYGGHISLLSLRIA
ncbi:hypothetical protein E2C01_003815 [Portunus trituberculatus]|uniref:Uncharacterized protein n=1 Tax=Portunus trituberculatus TaxID=210409 RepID=A0A5B7CS69_PORTR|nr:hypothetical protein [Portunus trituberculatus]